MDNNLERWYSMKEIMEYLGVSRDTVLDWIERREMPAAKIIDSMNGNFIKERFYAIPLENLPRINSHNAKPRLPFYH